MTRIRGIRFGYTRSSLLPLFLAITMAASHSPVSAATRKTAAVLGATGAVGKEIVKSLTARGWEAVLLNRREVADVDGEGNRIRQVVVPMKGGEGGGPLESSCEEILRKEGVDAVFVSMGVGAPSKYGGEEGAALLKRVDVDLPTACARGARKVESVKHFSILTAVGADVKAVPDKSDSMFGLISRARAGGGLYNHCKGKVEENIRSLGFPTFSTFRPAALLGTPNTPASVAFIMGLIDPILPSKWKCSDISILGEAMVKDAEDKLSAQEAGEVADTFEFDIFEGEPLHELYARVKREMEHARSSL